jgi:hypothetical protein
MKDDNPLFERVCSNDVETRSTLECAFTPAGETVRIEVRLVEALSASFELDVRPSE